MVQKLVQKTEIVVKEVDNFLQNLSNVSGLDDCPSWTRVMLQDYAWQYGKEDQLNDDQVCSLIAELLAEVWRGEVRELLRYQDPKQWAAALIPIAQYVDYFYRETLKEGSVAYEEQLPRSTRHGAARRLADTEWVLDWVTDKKVATEIATHGSELSEEAAEGYYGNYNNWRIWGLEWLCRGINRRLSPTPDRNQVKEMLQLPQHHVKRGTELARLRKKVLRAIRAGGWVALVGIAGIGKSTLLAELVRDRDMRQIFGDGIAVVKMDESDDALRVVYRSAGGLHESLPRGFDDAEKAGQALRKRLGERRALLIVDDVLDANMLLGLQYLGPKVVVVIATQTSDVAFDACIPSEQQMLLDGMAPEEAGQLAVKTGRTPESEEEWKALEELVRLLKGHPIGVRAAAAHASPTAAKMMWAHILQAARGERSRLVALGYGDQVQLNTWAPFEVTWGRISDRMREQLVQLGGLPRLAWYDVGVGQAIWNVRAEVSRVQWGKIARWQWVERIGAGRYRMHGLVKDFLQEKARTELTDMREHSWEFDYPLKDLLPGWRWYWPSFPHPGGGILPPWRCSQGTETSEAIEGKKFIWLDQALTRFFWQPAEDLNMQVSPEEWVVGIRRKRLRDVSGYLMVAAFSLGIPGMIASFVNLPASLASWNLVILVILLTSLAGMVAGWIFFFVATIDLRRMAGWRERGHAFPEKIGETKPA